MKIIDLSVTIEDNIASEELPPKIRYIDHKTGGLLLGLGLSWQGNHTFSKIFQLLKDIFSRKIITNKMLPDKIGLSMEKLSLSSHTGTHVDSPYHYGPGNIGIDQAPLEYFYGNGVKLDFLDRPAGSSIEEKDIVEKLQEIQYAIQPKDIVLIHSGADKFWGKKEYLQNYIGLGVSGLRYLLKQGVILIGTDGLGLDRPFLKMKELYWENKDNVHLWPAHFEGRRTPYYMIEKLANLDQLKSHSGFTVAAFPIKIKNASAGFARVVAFES